MSGQTKIAVGIGVVLIGVSAWYLQQSKPAAPAGNLNDIVAGTNADTVTPVEAVTEKHQPVAAAKPAEPETSNVASPAPRHIEDLSPLHAAGAPRPEPAETNVPTAAALPIERTGLSSLGSTESAFSTPKTTTAPAPLADMPPNVVKKDPPTFASATPATGLKNTTTKPATIDFASNAPKTTAAAATALKTHTIQKGETVSSIAVKYFGHVKYANLILKANPGKDPKKLYIGSKLNIPADPNASVTASSEGSAAKPTTGAPAKADTTTTTKTKATAAKPAAQPGEVMPPPDPSRAYTVQPGEGWYEVAKKFLGDGKEYPEIYELNKERVGGNPHLLKAGTVIELPKRAKMPAK